LFVGRFYVLGQLFDGFFFLVFHGLFSLGSSLKLVGQI